MKILITEDESSIREVIAAYLKRSGYTVFEAENGEQALDIFDKENIDGLILDLNIPEIDGLEVCKKIRKIDNDVPILMVTARTDEFDELTGLELGADDYIKKPFSPNILIARLETLLRRTNPEIITLGNLSLDTGKMVVKKGKKTIELTTTQFDILKELAAKPGHIFTREDLLKKVYKDGLDSDVLDRTIDAHIKSIRKAIEDKPSNPKYILTAIGKGYKSNDTLNK